MSTPEGTHHVYIREEVLRHCRLPWKIPVDVVSLFFFFLVVISVSRQLEQSVLLVDTTTIRCD